MHLNWISNMLSWMNSLIMTANTLRNIFKIYEVNANVHLNRNSTLHSLMSSSITTANKHVSNMNYIIMQSEKRFQIRPNDAQHSIGKMHNIPNTINTLYKITINNNRQNVQNHDQCNHSNKKHRCHPHFSSSRSWSLVFFMMRMNS